jgi:hypothetical protein
MGIPPLTAAVTGLGLTSAGAILWRQRVGAGTTVYGSDGQHPGPHDSIGVLDHAGARIVASGAPGTLKDLRLDGSRGEWTESGTRRTVRLQGRARIVGAEVP